MSAFSDPSGLTVEQIQSKLQQEDPSMFRQVMRDLNMDGNEPEWERKGLLEDLNPTSKTEAG